MATPTFLHVPFTSFQTSAPPAALIAKHNASASASSSSSSSSSSSLPHSLLNGSAELSYKLHPVVVMSILDHYKRRKNTQKRVVGTLLGERKGDRVIIKHAFAVPHTEVENDEKTEISVEIDRNKSYHADMLKMHAKVNPRDVVVGCYSTPDVPNPAESVARKKNTAEGVSFINAVIHGAYRDPNNNPAALTVEPILLIVDVFTSNNRLSIRAFTSSKLSRGGVSDIAARFECAPLELYAYEAEKIGIDALLGGHPDDTPSLDAPALLFNETELLSNAMEEFTDALDTCSKYVEKVKNGEIEGNPELGEAISNAIAAIPHVDASSFSTLFNSHVQDLLMLIYLANLTKTQIQLADKVNVVVSSQ